MAPPPPKEPLDAEWITLIWRRHDRINDHIDTLSQRQKLNLPNVHGAERLSREMINRSFEMRKMLV